MLNNRKLYGVAYGEKSNKYKQNILDKICKISARMALKITTVAYLKKPNY